LNIITIFFTNCESGHIFELVIVVVVVLRVIVGELKLGQIPG
jgi:hypothetical protein